MHTKMMSIGKRISLAVSIVFVLQTPAREKLSINEQGSTAANATEPSVNCWGEIMHEKRHGRNITMPAGRDSN